VSPFYDLRRLFQFRELLQSLDPGEPPKGSLIDPSHTASGRIGILSGSFNPPTLAHVELARRAKKLFGLDRVFFTLSRLTVDKEQIEGMILEDRLMLLSLLAEELRWASVAVFNRGLYFEQAKAFRSLLGGKARLSFIVGMDKLIQIFDPRYYRDREEALGILLTEAQLLVAMRGDLGMNDLEALLGRSENDPYRDRVFPFSLPKQLKGVSSSALREAVVSGEATRGEVPEIVEQFLVESKAYLSPYELRSELLRRLYEMREWAEENVDFSKLVASVQEHTEAGAQLRKLLESRASAEELKKILAR
jgi:nicotinic acid mononucleotide adenylyltransferase